jgi:acetoin utilization protein AcuB
MPKSTPKINKYMSTTPYAINSEAPVQEAMEMMNKHRIRHLPVMKQGKCFGLISDRDVKSIFAFAGTSPQSIKVGDVCVDEPYFTKPDAFLTEVATEMATRRVGSALVMDNEKLVGIFTATDACQALSDICNSRFHN